MPGQRQARQETLDGEGLEQERPMSDICGSSASKIAAVIENRAKEIGMAFFDLDEATLHLTQFAGKVQ